LDSENTDVIWLGNVSSTKCQSTTAARYLRQVVLSACPYQSLETCRMFFIARQHVMHAERDIISPLYVRLPVRPSVCPVPVLIPNEWIYRHTFWRSTGGIILVTKFHCTGPYAEKNSEVPKAPISRRRRRRGWVGIGEGYPPPQRTRGLGERRELLQPGVTGLFADKTFRGQAGLFANKLFKINTEPLASRDR